MYENQSPLIRLFFNLRGEQMSECPPRLLQNLPFQSQLLQFAALVEARKVGVDQEKGDPVCSLILIYLFQCDSDINSKRYLSCW